MPRKKKDNKRLRVYNQNLQLVKQLLIPLCKYQYSIEQLIELTGISPGTVRTYLNQLHQGPDNLIYIAEWKRSSTVGPYTKFWTFGYKMQDAPKPAALTKEAKNARARRAARKQKISEGVIRHVAD